MGGVTPLTETLHFLDIDLDAFQSDTEHWKSNKRRLSKTRYVPWREDTLRKFLEDRCKLSSRAKIPGRFAIEHDAALPYMEELYDHFGQELEVAHLDGHADLGLGDPSWVHLVTDWLAKKPSDRRRPPSHIGACNPGSYLAYAAAARFLADVKYAYPPGGGDDFPIILFHENSPRGGYLELKRFSPEDRKNLDYEELRADNAISVEPKIPYRAMPIENFQASKPFDRAFVCQSPGFTPKASDRLLYVLAEYIEFDSHSDALPTV